MVFSTIVSLLLVFISLGFFSRTVHHLNILSIGFLIKLSVVYSFFFFFQAEDGIRDLTVTGVQTCALPIYSARRYASEPDFNDWGHRLEIFGLDLRHTPSVEAFCRQLLARRSRLDFIVNKDRKSVV